MKPFLGKIEIGLGEVSESRGLMNYYYAREEEFFKKRITPLVGKPRGVYEIKVPRKWINSAFIALFNKPTGDIVCPHFWEFKPFIGCPFECSYCYLQGTFRGNKTPRLKNLTALSRELQRFLEWAEAQGLKILLNAGELADSLAVPNWIKRILDLTVPILEKFNHHKLLLLTKGGTRHIKPLIQQAERLRHYVIVSFSLNPQKVAERYEKKTASPSDRIVAAKNLQDLGYTIRIRIDPMICIPAWRIYYPLLVNEIFECGLKPERITIGSLRGLKKTLNFASDKEWIKYLSKKEKTEWGLKIKKDIRIDMYTVVIEKLREVGYTGPIALCKETLDVWMNLVEKGLLEPPGSKGVWEDVVCNCKL